MFFSVGHNTACISSVTPIHTPAYRCGKRSLICYKGRTQLARLLAFAALDTWIWRWKPPSPMTLLNSALRVDANLLAIDASQTAVTDVKLDATLRACTKSSH